MNMTLEAVRAPSARNSHRMVRRITRVAIRVNACKTVALSECRRRARIDSFPSANEQRGMPALLSQLNAFPRKSMRAIVVLLLSARRGLGRTVDASLRKMIEL